MTDTYDEQIDAILAGDVERFIAALGDSWNSVEKWERDDLRDQACGTIYSRAWDHTGEAKASLFTNLPGCNCCASQIQSREYRDTSEAKRLYTLIRRDSKMVLRNPVRSSEPTREILNEFARRQRLCRAA